MKISKLLENIIQLSNEAKKNGISLQQLGEMELVEYNQPRNSTIQCQSIKLTLIKNQSGKHSILKTDYGEKHDLIMRKTQRSY